MLRSDIYIYTIVLKWNIQGTKYHGLRDPTSYDMIFFSSLLFSSFPSKWSSLSFTCLIILVKNSDRICIL